MSYTLVGSRYIGSGSKPTPVVGYDLVDNTNGDIYAAGVAGWNLIGNVNSVNLGLLSRSGGNMTGAITGATGWAPLDRPWFTTSAKLEGIDLVTSDQLSTTQSSILNSIAPKITEAVASTTSAINVSSKMAIAKGFLFPLGTTKTEGATDTIPLPTYPGGTTASISECIWAVGIYSVPDNGNGLKKILVTNPGDGLNYTSDCYLDAGNWTGHAVLQYMIIGVKS